VVCVDNVILFPAIKKYGKPWIRIISCSENEVPDPDIPPHLSGCSEGDHAGYKAFEDRFLALVKPTHDRFNAFLKKVGHPPYPLGEFFETSPHMNLLLYPRRCSSTAATRSIQRASSISKVVVRGEGTYTVPAFAEQGDKPLSMSASAAWARPTSISTSA
jgi:UDP:flavonoid glycosyltransferase YjiC (YdhE family)